jgi:hypothetical protein
MFHDHSAFRHALAGVVAGALLMAAFPAVAASVGDALALGTVNKVDARTTLKGDASGATLQVQSTGTASAILAKADRNAVRVTVDAGKSPITVNRSAGTARNLSADQLDGMDSTAFRVVAAHGGSTGDWLVTADPEVVGSVILTAPTAGLVIVDSAARVFEDTAGDRVGCSITTGTSVDNAYLQRWESPGDPGKIASLAGTRGFEVAAGVFTANLVCEHTGVSGDAVVSDPKLTAIFVPGA